MKYELSYDNHCLDLPSLTTIACNNYCKDTILESMTCFRSHCKTYYVRYTKSR